MESDMMAILQQPINAVPTSIAAASAEQVLRRLQTVITEFMATIKPDQEVAIALASFGQSHVIVVDSVTALGPQLIVFSGVEGEKRVQLVQHVSQLNFLLLAAPAAVPGHRRTIGFQTE